jgi:hypothetical protein
VLREAFIRQTGLIGILIVEIRLFIFIMFFLLVAVTAAGRFLVYSHDLAGLP